MKDLLLVVVTILVGVGVRAECAGQWRGVRVCAEVSREGYDRSAFGTGYASLEDEIIEALPSGLRRDGYVLTPMSCAAFPILPDGTAATDIDHVVALAEAHDSGIDDTDRRAFGADLDNLTVADPHVNRYGKNDRDAGEWQPGYNIRWYAERVLAVKAKYDLSIDPAELAALSRMIEGGSPESSCP